MSTDLIPQGSSPGVTQLAMASTHKVVNLEVMLRPEYDGPQVIGTLDLTSDDGREWYLTSAGAVDIDREMACQEWFPVSYWTAEYRDNIAQEGEPPKSGVRVTLYSPDGATFAFAGVVPHDSFRRIRSIFGDGPWPTPLWFNGREIKTSKGRSTYILIARSNKPL